MKKLTPKDMEVLEVMNNKGDYLYKNLSGGGEKLAIISSRNGHPVAKGTIERLLENGLIRKSLNANRTEARRFQLTDEGRKYRNIQNNKN